MTNWDHTYMSTTLRGQGRLAQAEAIVTALPTPDYPINFQPTYADSGQLTEAVSEMLGMEPVTTPEQVDALSAQLAIARASEGRMPIIMTSSCAESVDMKVPVEVLVERAISERKLVLSAMPAALYIGRKCGQNAKPRSSANQKLSNGLVVPSYMGDMINDYDPTKREPDPSRLVAAALQAKAVEQGMRRILGFHPWVSHEALSLPYEASFKRSVNGRQYLLSGDTAWIGFRTNKAEGPHVQMMSDVENTVGVKLGPGTDANHIKALVQTLNPHRKIGKLLFMIRVGKDEQAMNSILEVIAEEDPGANITYDIHGTKRKVEGCPKVRAVPDIVDDILLLAAACKAYGRRLGGLHLETHTIKNRYECVDEIGQLPKHESMVDPGLNPSQTVRVLEEVAHVFTGTY